MNELQLKMAEINKKYKAQIIQEGTDIIKIKKIPFSSPMANYMTYGGIPVAKITEFFGGEGGGKTTSALDICGNAQRLFTEEYDNKVNEIQQQIDTLATSNTRESAKQIVKLEQELQQIMDKGAKCVLYVDTEQTLDVEWAKTIGVDTESLILIRPQEQTAEQILQMIIELIDTGGIGLCILDSIPCLVPQNIFEESLEKKSYGGISQPLTVFCSKILPYLTVNQCAFIGINQIREDLSSMYSTMSTPGGKAWKHACSLRLRFRKDSYLDDKNNEVSSRCENPAGNKVGIEIIKTKVCKPDRRLGYYTLNYMSGIDVVYDTINVAIFYNIIGKAGSWYRVLDDNGNIMKHNDTDLNFQGLSKCKEYLTQNEDLLQDVIRRLEDEMNG